jgi:hypothetical protein
MTVLFGAIVAATGFASPAAAGCADLTPLTQRAWLTPAASRPMPFVMPTKVAPPATRSSSDPGAPIVGLWQVAFASDGNNVAPFFIPDGAPLDAGYVQWHSDGTEIMNSSRDPATTNFCLGVWQSDGARTYKLNHFALSWDTTGTLCTPPAGSTSCFVGPTNIREQITVDAHGDSYAGTVTIDQYNTTGQLLFSLKGKVTAQRITAN